MRSWIFGLAVLSLAMATAGAPARADGPWMFAQVTCVPTLGYFAIQRTTIMNLPQMGPYLTEGISPGAGAREALQRDNGFFDSDSLERAPFTCSIADFKPPTGWGSEERPAFTVQVVGHYDRNSEEGSYCRIADNAEVIVDGKSIGQIVLNPCKNGELTVSIEVAHNGVELVTKRCVEPSVFDDPAENHIICTETPVRDVK